MKLATSSSKTLSSQESVNNQNIEIFPSLSVALEKIKEPQYTASAVQYLKEKCGIVLQTQLKTEQSECIVFAWKGLHLSAADIEKKVIVLLPIKDQITRIAVASLDLISTASFIPFVNLQECVFSMCTQLKDTTSLAQLPYLEHIGLIGCNQLQAKSLEETLAQCMHLKILYLETINLIRSLPQIDQIKELTLIDCVYFKDISFLKQMPQLRSLSLKGCYNIKDYSVLIDLPALQKLDLSCLPRLENLDVLHNMKQLKTLILRQCSRLSNIVAILSMPALKVLDLEGCHQIEGEQFEKLQNKLAGLQQFVPPTAQESPSTLKMLKV